MTITLQAATSEIFSLLVPMERVFESFIAGVILQHPHILPKGISCKTQYHAGYLAMNHRDQGLFKLKLDIVLFQKKPCAVIDTKYKLLSEKRTHDNVNQGDVYQMYAYGAKTVADTIMLLYPDDGESFYLNWKMEYDNGRQIDLLIRSVTLSIDLIREMDTFIKQLTHIINEVCTDNLNGYSEIRNFGNTPTISLQTD